MTNGTETKFTGLNLWVSYDSPDEDGIPHAYVGQIKGDRSASYECASEMGSFDDEIALTKAQATALDEGGEVYDWLDSLGYFSATDADEEEQARLDRCESRQSKWEDAY